MKSREDDVKDLMRLTLDGGMLVIESRVRSNASFAIVGMLAE